MSLSFAFESQDFCCAENLIFLAVTSAFRLDNLGGGALVPRDCNTTAVGALARCYTIAAAHISPLPF